MNINDFQLVIEANKRVLRDFPKKRAYGVLDVVALAYGLMQKCDDDPQFMQLLTYGFEVNNYITIDTTHGLFVRIACDMLMRSTNETYTGVIPQEIEYKLTAARQPPQIFDISDYWDGLSEFALNPENINQAINAGRHISKLSTYYSVLNNTRMADACDNILYNIWMMKATANNDIISTKKTINVETLVNVANKVMLYNQLTTQDANI